MARVWLLDNRSVLIRMIARWLERAGHRIVWCSNSSEVERARHVSGQMDLLIMDVDLKDSAEVGLSLTLGMPNLKLLCISEYSPVEWSLRNAALFYGLPTSSVQVLRKPFSGLALLTKVDDLIGAQHVEASDVGVSASA